MRKIRLLITGGSSYLGQHLVPLSLIDFQTNYTYFSNDPLRLPAGYRLDIRDESAVHHLVQTLQPEVIIHTVGSNRPNDMATIITQGTRHITQAAQVTGARLIHISTDVVFNGQNAPYAEEDAPAPIHAYGRAKAEAEEIVQQHPAHVIVRTSLIYGLHTMDRGTAWMIEALDAGQTVTLFSDQRRNPVWVDTLCLACLELADSEYQGILNVAGEQVVTRAEFAYRMLDWWGYDKRTNLVEGRSDPAQWPADCSYDLSRARKVLKTPLWGVDTVLQRQKSER